LCKKEQSKELLHIKLIIEAAQTEALLDRLEAAFTSIDDFRIIIASVEATIPRIEKTETTDKPKEPISKKIKFARVSREELYSDIHEASRLSWLFVVMVALSAIVAAIGLLRNNTAVIIGAMVIAPLLGPNVALALSATLGDIQLAKNARKANLVGIALPLFFSALVGMIFAADPLPDEMPEILSRTHVNLSDIILALAAGCVATLSFTMSLSGALIGVMVAVALLPPLVAAGILLGCAQWQPALGAALLFATNLICVNLAGISTFLIQGVRPLWWWDKQRAKKATRQAMTIWIFCLLLLILLILASQRWGK
jgi:uncharacterized hydrophobic protein (TIGR00341 family)